MVRSTRSRRAGRLSSRPSRTTWSSALRRPRTHRSSTRTLASIAEGLAIPAPVLGVLATVTSLVGSAYW
ncbi:hypothetical protein ACFYWX_34410 [Streptomyces sp. NPDC002888]|uniref:hypothetical protein n=1 Tax=Streptomyces sp. NPDC002888 TaxID=3364668 RepID=UPI0036B79864